MICRRVEYLQHMLNMYYEAVESVPQTELELLKPILKDLESSLDAGFHVLNWNSLGIADFTQQCRKAINEFNTRIGQVLKNKRDIEALVQAIASTRMLPEVDTTTVPTLQVCSTAVVESAGMGLQVHNNIMLIVGILRLHREAPL